jgi:hypothetical protein
MSVCTLQRFAASSHGVGVVLVRSDAQDNGVFRDDGIEMPLDVPASLSRVSTSTSEMDENLTRWKGIPERVLQGKCTLFDARRVSLDKNATSGYRPYRRH